MLPFRAFAQIRVKQALSRLGPSGERFRARGLLLLAETHRENAPTGKTIRGRPPADQISICENGSLRKNHSAYSLTRKWLKRVNLGLSPANHA